MAPAVRGFLAVRFGVPAGPAFMGPPNYEALLGTLEEVLELLQCPGAPGNIDRANARVMSIAKATPPGSISDMATRLIREVNALRADPSDRIRVNGALLVLLLALQEARSPQTH
jgi:hypothetical protein